MDPPSAECELVPSAVPEDLRHSYFMKQALLMVSSLPRVNTLSAEQILQGEKALQSGETPVGCVLVHNDRIVGSGMNDTNRSMNVSLLRRCTAIETHGGRDEVADDSKGTRHAEFLAIAELLQTYPRSTLQSTDLYVTVEPCVMCASALKQYRIRSVYYGCANDRFGGTGGVLSLHSESVTPCPVTEIMHLLII